MEILFGTLTGILHRIWLLQVWERMSGGIGTPGFSSGILTSPIPSLGMGLSVLQSQKHHSSNALNKSKISFIFQLSTGITAPIIASRTKWFAVAKIVRSIARGQNGANQRSQVWGANLHRQTPIYAEMPKLRLGIAAMVSRNWIRVHALCGPLCKTSTKPSSGGSSWGGMQRQLVVIMKTKDLSVAFVRRILLN